MPTVIRATIMMTKFAREMMVLCQLLLVWTCCHRLTVCERQPQSRLLNAIRPQPEGGARGGSQKRDVRIDGSEVDLRGHRLFTSDPRLDCCPTVTELSGRLTGINPHGIVLELFHTHNFTQSFYETLCDPRIKDAHCQYVDERWRAQSRCVQQFTYVYAIGRTFGAWHERFRMDYVRIATGCKCQLHPLPGQQLAMRQQAVPSSFHAKSNSRMVASPPLTPSSSSSSTMSGLYDADDRPD